MENIILFILVLILPCIFYSMITIVYGKYKNKDIKKKLSGFEVARKLLDENDLKDIYIVEVKGSLNDHYDYNQKVIRLSTDVYHGETIMAVAVAAKISSYAIQDKNNNTFMKFRSVVNPVMTFAVYLAYIVFLLGLCLQDYGMVNLATIIMAFSLIFHLITLPVEFEASRIASKSLKELDRLTKEEIDDTSNVLKSSNYTFVMSILTCISTLFNEILYNMKRKG